MKRVPESHLDHGLTVAQVEYIFARFAERSAFFIETFELPPDLGTVMCGLHGPLVGDAPVLEAETAPRGSRAWPSRMVERPARPTRTVTVIAGPHEEKCGCGPHCGPIVPGSPSACLCCKLVCHSAGVVKHACVLYTAFGGPLAPQEPGDPGCKDVEASTRFWAEHALSK